jgi:hypothetical protein
MATTAQSAIAIIGIDIGKNSFHVVGLDGRGLGTMRGWCRRGTCDPIPKARRTTSVTLRRLPRQYSDRR